jgi:sugar transferase (PEP-CTERM system associated)
VIRLFHRYWSLPAAIALSVEGPLLFLAVCIGVWLRLGVPKGTVVPPSTFFSQGAAFTAVVLLALYANGLYDFAERLTSRGTFVATLRAFTIAAVALWALYFLVPDLQLGRGVFALALAASATIVPLWRLALDRLLSSDRFAERVLIVGASDKAVDIAREVLHRRHLGYRVVGFLDDAPELQGASLINPRVIGTTPQCRELALAHGATRVVVAPGDFRGRVSMDALLECKTSGIPVEDGASYYEQLTGKIMLEGLRKSWLIFSDGFFVSRGVLIGKRALDLAVATVALVLAAPLMALVALAIRLDSPGAVLFRQERVGRNRRPFTLWKFRSMRQDAEAHGARWATERDPRVTRIGRFLRKTRLDELPQLWNVLVGDMSLVGPRPEREMFVRQLCDLNEFYEQRLVVRPGLTGWAQIKAPYASSFEESLEKLKFDLYYVKHISLFLDISIVLSTVRIVLLGRGAR